MQARYIITLVWKRSKWKYYWNCHWRVNSHFPMSCSTHELPDRSSICTSGRPDLPSTGPIPKPLFHRSNLGTQICLCKCWHSNVYIHKCFDSHLHISEYCQITYSAINLSQDVVQFSCVIYTFTKATRELCCPGPEHLDWSAALLLSIHGDAAPRTRCWAPRLCAPVSWT